MEQPPNPPQQPPLAGRMMALSASSIVIRWAARVMGVVSLAICARVLTPADYGIVAMAMAAVSFSTILVSFGIETGLLRLTDATPSHYDTAWSLKLLQYALLGAILLVAAPLAGYLYKDDRVAWVILSIGASILLAGASNIYTANFLRNADWRMDILYNVVPKLFGVVAAIVLAFMLRSYWALVGSIVLGNVATFVLSYTLVPQRPRWSLEQLGYYKSFSIWFFVQGLAEFALSWLDRIVIGAAGGAHRMGLYSIGRELAALANTELTLPISRALVPTLSRLNESPQRLQAAIEKVFHGTCVVSLPAAVGLSVLADDFVYWMLGAQWGAAAPIVAAFAIAGTFSAFRLIAASILVSNGKTRIGAILTWANVVLVVAAIYPAYVTWGFDGVANAYLICNAVVMLLAFAMLYQQRLVLGWKLLFLLARPVLAALAMAGAIWLSADHLAAGSLHGFLAKIALGGVVYVSVTVILWWLVGRPDTIETTFYQLFSQLSRRVRKRFAKPEPLGHKKAPDHDERY